MASAFATEFLADALPDLIDEFGESVTHRPLNDSTDDATVTVIFREMEPIDLRDRGVGIKRRAKLTCDSDVSASVRDRWKRGDDWWEAVRVSQPMGGYIEIDAERCEDEIRSPKRASV